ncbi:MAG TPA: MerR family transcriptional regulator [Vicinamibacterales bacterium]|nr:MerR family transcriptional regulator [Vicinamibacterales bacterium]
MTSTMRYPIAAVARLTGLTLDTIRAWERRYDAVTPERGVRGRLYTDAQVGRLRLLAALVRQGHAISQVANLPDARLEELLRRTLNGQEKPGRAAAAGAAAQATRTAAGLGPITRVVAAIERFDFDEADREVGRLASLYPARELVHEVALPLMRIVGERWHAGKLSAAQEHMVSSILHAVMAGIVRLHPASDAAPRLLFATPQGELHEFGILAAAMLAASSRFGIVYLGANLPAAEIGAAAARAGATVAVIGTSGGAAASIEQAGAIRRAVPAAAEVWVGGPSPLSGRSPAGRHGRLIGLRSFEDYEGHLRRLAGGTK